MEYVEIGWIFLNKEKQEIKDKVEKLEKGFNNPNIKSNEREVIQKQIKTLKKYISLLEQRKKFKEWDYILKQQKKEEQDLEKALELVRKSKEGEN